MKSRPVHAAHGLAFSCAFVVAAAAFSSAARAQAPQYVVTDLGTLGGTFSAATGINDNGQITGDAYTAAGVTHAFLYSGGVMSDIDTLNSAFSIGFSINNAGQVVGDASYTYPPFDATFGFLYTGGSMSALGSTTEARVINNSGQIAGTIGTDAFLYTAGTYQSLGTLSTVGFGQSNGLGLNNLGQVVGASSTTNNPDIQNAFLYSAGKMTDLNGPFSFQTYIESAGLAINDSGQITGTYDGQAFLYSGGRLTQLGSLSTNTSEGFGINNAGQVVGDSILADGSTEHAILDSNGTLYDLNNLVTNLAGTDFSYLEFAEGINNPGTIVGAGVTTDGDTHAFEAQLVPSPEPGSGTLLLLAAALAASSRQFKRVQMRGPPPYSLLNH